MKNIILSINNKYVKKILNREKLYEFRGWIWKEKVNYVYIYASGTIKQIVGRFQIEYIDNDIPNRIWQRYKDKSGVSESEFFSYVKLFNYKVIYAIKINKLQILKKDNYIDLNIISLNKAPQKFKYLNIDENKVLEGYFSE